MITKALLQAILAQYRLPTYGLHGVDHWARVLENGRRLSRETGANLTVVEYFAVLHDACRHAEHTDPFHGRRGADFALSLRGSLVYLDPAAFELLKYACCCHAEGYTEGDVTVQTCWDSDRLDLARAGILPDPLCLCTSAAKKPEMITWATTRSANRVKPDWMLLEWSIPS
jgi:uncharacterized protein